MKALNIFSCSIFCFAILVLFFIWLEPDLNSAIAQYFLWIQSVQRGFHTNLSEALRAIQIDGFRASIVLAMVSFVYGVLHAAGPGHGKLVISTYLLSHESHVRRGVILSFAAALTQGLTAVAVVSLAFLMLKLTMGETRGIYNQLEVVSFAMVAIVGLYITCTHLLRIRKKVTFVRGANESRAHCSLGCNHNHVPSVSDIEKKLSFRSFVGIVLAIGIRPCSGAVVVLLLAFSLDHVVDGLFAVLAMSLGTALTITLLATISLYFKKTAKRIAQPKQAVRQSGDLISGIIGVFGGGLIFILGLSFLGSVLTAPVHPFR